jgi:hypothetical protein
MAHCFPCQPILNPEHWVNLSKDNEAMEDKDIFESLVRSLKYQTMSLKDDVLYSKKIINIFSKMRRVFWSLRAYGSLERPENMPKTRPGFC